MMGQFQYYSAPGGHGIIPGELGNIWTVLRRAWKTGKGNTTIAQASISFTEWSRYLGNPVEEVISLAIEGVTGPPELMGNCQHVLGGVYHWRGRLDDAEASFEHAVQLHRQAHNVIGEANAIKSLGDVSFRRGQLDDAEASFERAIQLHQQAHDVLGEANAIQSLGGVSFRRGRLDDAEASFEHAVQLHRQAHNVQIGPTDI
ncbi:hypothetical protein H0H87_002459 [Tephrocybe sp. NHM501043]|nr:hypothetical protein H0H87_002459 [Tephrocybe sp. NHM501043]